MLVWQRSSYAAEEDVHAGISSCHLVVCVPSTNFVVALTLTNYKVM